YRGDRRPGQILSRESGLRDQRIQSRRPAQEDQGPRCCASQEESCARRRRTGGACTGTEEAVKILKLVFGWLFLAGFTAAGTYYAMDEVDHRVGLARFQLHERLGIIRYQVPVPIPVNPNPV